MYGFHMTRLRRYVWFWTLSVASPDMAKRRLGPPDAAPLDR